MFLAFFVGALGEELGWSGYVLHSSHFDMRLGGLVTAFAATMVVVIQGQRERCGSARTTADDAA